MLVFNNDIVHLDNADCFNVLTEIEQLCINICKDRKGFPPKNVILAHKSGTLCVSFLEFCIPELSLKKRFSKLNFIKIFFSF